MATIKKKKEEKKTKFLAVDKAWKAIVWPIPGLKQDILTVLDSLHRGP